MADTPHRIEVAEHLAAVLSSVDPLPPEARDLDTARGRVLRRDALAAVDVPAFDASAMDGFAVRFDSLRSLPQTLAVVADLPAGTAEDPRMDATHAARIMTGAPVPTDADTVVPFEDTRAGLQGGLAPVEVVAAPRSRGAHIRPRGSDVQAGETVVAAGTRLTAARVAAIAASGVALVSVSRAARVAVVSTGSELSPPGAALGRGRIPESNGLLLSGLAAEAGAEVVLRTSVPDEGETLRRALDAAEAAGADVVVLSGGVSAGAYEVVKATLGEVMDFVQVAMQPGRPQGFGRTAAGTLLFGLPGNPVSAAVSFDLFVRPALRALEGEAVCGRPLLPLALAAAWRARPDRTQYVPVRIDRAAPRWTVLPPVRGKAGSTRGLGEADGLAVIPPGEIGLVAGDVVDVLLW